MIGPRIGTKIGPRIGPAIGVTADEISPPAAGGGTMPSSFVAGHMIGDGQSNFGTGQGTTQTCAADMAVAFADATIRNYADSNRDGTFDIDSNGGVRWTLRPYATGASAGMGPPLSMLRAISALTPAPTPLDGTWVGANGSPEQEQDTFPAAGAGSYGAIFRALIAGESSALGKVVSLAVLGHMESDATNDAWTAAHEANLEAHWGAAGSWVTAIGTNDFLRVVPEICTASIGGLAGLMTVTRINAVNAARQSFVATDPTRRLLIPQALLDLCTHNSGGQVSMNYFNTTDDTHYYGNGAWAVGMVMGQLVAEKAYPALDPWNRGPFSGGATPWLQFGDSQFCMPFLSNNTAASGDYRVMGPIRVVDGEIQFLVVSNGILTTDSPANDPALATANGFALQRNTKAVLTTSTESSSIFRRTIAGSARPDDVLVDDVSVQKGGLVFSVRGGDVAGIVEGGTGMLANTTAITWAVPGLSTVVDNCIVIVVAVGFCSNANKAISSLALSGVPDLTVVRDAGGVGSKRCAIAVGTKATAGSLGAISGAWQQPGLTSIHIIAIPPA